MASSVPDIENLIGEEETCSHVGDVSPSGTLVGPCYRCGASEGERVEQFRSGESDVDYLRHAAHVIEGLTMKGGNPDEMAAELRAIADRIARPRSAPAVTLPTCGPNTLIRALELAAFRFGAARVGSDQCRAARDLTDTAKDGLREAFLLLLRERDEAIALQERVDAMRREQIAKLTAKVQSLESRLQQAEEDGKRMRSAIARAQIEVGVAMVEFKRYAEEKPCPSSLQFAASALDSAMQSDPSISPQEKPE